MDSRRRGVAAVLVGVFVARAWRAAVGEGWLVSAAVVGPDGAAVRGGRRGPFGRRTVWLCGCVPLEAGQPGRHVGEGYSPVVLAGAAPRFGVEALTEAGRGSEEVQEAVLVGAA